MTTTNGETATVQLHRWAIGDIRKANSLTASDAAAFERHVAYLRAEGDVALAGLRAYGGFAVPGELKSPGYLRWLWQASRESSAKGDAGAALADRVQGLQQISLLRLPASERHYVVAAEALGPECLRKIGPITRGILKSQLLQLVEALRQPNPVDLRVLPPGMAKQAKVSETAFTILTNGDGSAQVFVEQDGLLQPTDTGTASEYGEVWQGLADNALSPFDSTTFFAQQLAKLQ